MKYAVAAFVLTVASAAGAAPVVTGEAQVEWQGEPREEIIVDETIWRCFGTMCRGRLVDHQPTRLRSCLKLANQTARVVAFRTPAANFDEDELARCNRER